MSVDLGDAQLAPLIARGDREAEAVLPSHGAAVDAPGRPANPQSDAPTAGAGSVIRQQSITWARVHRRCRWSPARRVHVPSHSNDFRFRPRGKRPDVRPAARRGASPTKEQNQRWTT